MARIAYLDHSYHMKTLSTDFLPNVLRRKGHTVDYFWDDAWQGGELVPWDALREYDVVIMFQSFAKCYGDNYRVQHPNVIFIPMLDQFGVWKGPLFNLTEFWKPFQGSKIISLSNAVHGMTVGAGLRSYHTRYYQPEKPQTKRPLNEGLRGFFWLRRENELPWRVIRELIATSNFESFHLHLAHDPGHPSPTLPSQEDIDKFNIITSTWFEKKEDYKKVLKQANVFFAPRIEEGIGQSFLEAFTEAQCVVAPDQGTMNEYILSGLNGLLYDPLAPTALDFSNAIEMGRNGQFAAQQGRKIWEEKEDALTDFVLTPSQDLYVDRYQHVLSSRSFRKVVKDKASRVVDKNMHLRRFVWVARRGLSAARRLF